MSTKLNAHTTTNSGLRRKSDNDITTKQIVKKHEMQYSQNKIDTE